MAAASLGTQKLLHRMKDEGHLPRLSDRLGYLSRTNSESILGAIAPKNDPTDYTYGVAITSSFHPDADTHVEPVRYGKGFNTMAMLQTVLTDGDDSASKTRIKTWLREIWTQRKSVLDLYDFKHWSERTVIALVMQTVDNSITTYGKKGPFGRWCDDAPSRATAPQPDLDPGRQRRRTPDGRADRRHRRRQHRRAVRHAADRPLHRRLRDRRLRRDRRGRRLPARLRPPRACTSPTARRISANLGVNPSLTITAQAERAMAFWPNHGEADPRPALGAPYQRITPVAPTRPAVAGDGSGSAAAADRRDLLTTGAEGRVRRAPRVTPGARCR
jgi:cholesterol oxidase